MEETQWKELTEEPHMGIYGWKKIFLFLLILILLFVVTLNLSLVLWLMKVLHFNTNGMTCIHVIGNGIQFTGKTYLLDSLVASGFFTRKGEAISIKSAKNLTLRTTDRSGYAASNIYMEDGKLEINTPIFKVTEPMGKILFSVDKDTVSLTANSLSISGEGGAVLDGSLWTPIVSADIRSDLVLEAAKKGVQTVTPAGVSIESRAGDIIASSHHDISLITVDGSIKLESGNILMPTLRRLSSSHHMRKHHHHSEKIYQLCICGNGELYLGESDTFCEIGPNDKMCQ